jgi:hypothetical protein
MRALEVSGIQKANPAKMRVSTMLDYHVSERRTSQEEEE